MLLAVSAVTAAFLPPLFWAALGGYLVTTTAYSLAIKRMLLIDVLTLAGLYTMRILAGAAATGTDGLVLAARLRDLLLPVAGAGEALRRAAPVGDWSSGERIAGRGYRAEDQEIIAQAGMASAFSSALVLALYIDSDAVQGALRQPVDDVAGGADHPLPHHARLDPGAPRRDA